MDWKLALAGLLIGVLVGLTGMGGGSLMTPMLILLFGFKPAVAIGTDIAHGAIFKTVGAIQHRRMGNVRARLSGWMFIGSAPASLGGVWLAHWLEKRYGDNVESVGAQVLGGVLVFGAIGLMAKTILRPKETDDHFVMTRRDRIAAITIGVIGGFVVGLTSVGTGVFFGLTMLVIFPLQAHKIVGTDIFHAAALLYVAGAGHMVAGNVDLATMGWLLCGSIPGVLLGGHLTISIPERPLRVVLACVLGLSGLKLLDIPGAGLAIVVVVAIGITALLVWIGRHTWLSRRNGRRVAAGEEVEPA